MVTACFIGRNNAPRRACFHCSSVISGMSERSIWSSGRAANAASWASSSWLKSFLLIVSPFVRGGFPGADDTHDLLIIVGRIGVNDDQNRDWTDHGDRHPPFLVGIGSIRHD